MAAPGWDVVLAAGATLGEGPVWVGDRLWWVDIEGERIHRTDPTTAADDVIDTGEPIGAIVPRAGGGSVGGMVDGVAIFDSDGEPAFRDLEAAVIADLCRRQRLVLAAGGGAPLREESRRAMRESGKVVWLKADAETIHRRMQVDATTPQRRPDLTDESGIQEIVQLLAKREPVYRQSAHLELDTTAADPELLAAQILDRLQFKPDAESPA